jgi:hypothetical protein
VISAALHIRLERREALHKGCEGPIKALFYMIVCEKCHKTVDEETDIILEWKGE